MGFFERAFLGNELWRWLVYAGIVFLAIMLSKTVAYFFRVVVKRFTRRTRFELDDLILGIIQKPVGFLILFSGIYWGLRLITYEGGTVADIDLIRSVYAFIVTLVLVWLIARLYGDIMHHYLKPLVEDTETKLDDQLMPLAIKGGRFIIWAIGLVIALDELGLEVTSLIAGLGIGGLALAMAAKDTIANVFGGASIFADRPFEIGDVIEVAGTTGTVTEIGVRTTRIRTFEDTIFVMPNSKVADSAIENLSARRKRRRLLKIGLTYDTTYEQMQQAKELVRKILAEVGGIEADPTIRFEEFGDSALVLQIIYWVEDVGEYFTKLDQVNERILKEFAEAGLEMAFPTQTLYVKQ